jgi:hypothetical protein
MRNEPFVADMSIEPGRRSAALAAIDRGNPGRSIVLVLKAERILMTRLAWWVVGFTHECVQRGDSSSRELNGRSVATGLQSRRALRAYVSPLATYDCSRGGRDAAVSPSTAICSKRSTVESSASGSLGQGDPERSAFCSLGQGDPERSASGSLGQGKRHIDAGAGTARAPQYSD